MFRISLNGSQFSNVGCLGAAGAGDGTTWAFAEATGDTVVFAFCEGIKQLKALGRATATPIKTPKPNVTTTAAIVLPVQNF